MRTVNDSGSTMHAMSIWRVLSPLYECLMTFVQASSTAILKCSTVSSARSAARAYVSTKRRATSSELVALGMVMECTERATGGLTLEGDGGSVRSDSGAWDHLSATFSSNLATASSSVSVMSKSIGKPSRSKTLKTL